jgi:hypothetical protein
MKGGRARAASMTAEERRAWSDYMRRHQRRFWDGETLPRKPVTAGAPVSMGTAQANEWPAVRTPVRREPVPPPIPTVVIPRAPRIDPMAETWKMRPAMRFDV